MNDAGFVVRLGGVGKRYGRRSVGRWALRGIELSIYSGEVVGFIGPNGAGKTTLIKLLSGLSRATEGEIEVLGRDLKKEAVTPEGIGLVVEHPSFVPYLSGRKNLKLLAAIRGVADEEIIASTLRIVGLEPEDRRPTRAYSLGMRQRLGLAQALMEDPRLLLLDEPTNGLDPQGIVELRGLIRRLARNGVAIFVASHLLTEVERVCDRVILVHSGRVVKEINQREEASPALRIAVSDERDLDVLLGWAREMNFEAQQLLESPVTQPEVLVETSLPTPEVVRGLVEAGVRIEEVRRERRTLEQEFMELVGHGDAAEA